MARPISASHELRRDEILNVAAALFARQSYPATSMNDIAGACGTSKARLYHYYESKEAILFDLLDRYTQRLLVLIGQAEGTAHRQKLDERAALHQLIRAFLGEEGIGLRAVMEQVHRVAPVPQAERNSVGQGLVVFDDGDTHD